MRTLVIGRSPSADVVIADVSVAPHHAELVITDDGRLHLTDCVTEGGTWRRNQGEGEEATWHPVRQAFVDPDDALRFGDHRCSAGDLVRRSNRVFSESATDGGGWTGAARARVRGPVVRDPATGEIVRRRP